MSTNAKSSEGYECSMKLLNSLTTFPEKSGQEVMADS